MSFFRLDRWSALTNRKTPRWRRVDLAVHALEERLPPAAQIWTDLPDYAPGSTAQISGSGFTPGEKIHLDVMHIDTVYSNEYPTWNVVDGGAGDLDGVADGSFVTTWQVGQIPGSTLRATATGVTSGLMATTTFTDDIHLYSVSVGGQNGARTYGTAGSSTYTVTFDLYGYGDGPTLSQFKVNWVIAKPTGVSTSFSPSSISVPDHNTSDRTTTLTITTTADTPAGCFYFHVSASDGDDTESTWFPGSLTVDKRNITVTAAANTKTYDGNTSAAATPTITSGSLASGDTANFIETYSNDNAGTGKTLTPSGTVNDGDGGENYNVTFVSINTGVINKRNITVTAAANTKTYDGNTSASATPTITTGSLAAGDSASFSQSYDTKHVGTGKTLTPSGSVNDGNSGGNYNVTFAAITTGVINKRNISVTAAANSKTYDGGTSASATPTITSGSLASGDSASFSETYNNKNFGTGKTLTPSGSVNDGNSGGNYNVTFVAANTGTISKRSLSVTAVVNTKEYDGTTSAAAIPAITSGTLAPGDTAMFTETYDNKHVGTGKTLNPVGSVDDGNGGANYTISHVSIHTGTITKRSVTVTASFNTKTYDGTTSAAAIPTITSGSLGAGDTASFSEVYADKNVGTAIVLTPSGSIDDGNGGANYAISFASISTGEITALGITVSAVADTKIYDGDTTSAVEPIITAGVLVSGDVAAFTQTFDTRDVGTNKTLTPSGVVDDGNGGSNYSITFVAVSTGEITVRAITVTAVTNSKTYDGTTTAAAAPVITGGSLVLGDTPWFSESYDTRDVGTGKTLTASGWVDDGNGGANYDVAFVDDTTGEITALAITVSATADTKIYDGDTTSAAVPTITGGALASGDAPAFTQTFDTRDVGTNKTLTPASVVDDGNGGNNYSVTFVAVSTGEITVRTITVTAVTNSKTYDGTTDAAATPVVTSGSVVVGDTPWFSESYDTRDVGTGKTLTASGWVDDGNGGANYDITFVDDTTGEIIALAITVTASTDSKVYDGGTSSAATPTITQGNLVKGDTPLFTQMFDTRHVGSGKTLTPSGWVDDGNGGANYDITFLDDITGEITARAITVTAVANTRVYDGTTAAAALPMVTSGTLAPGDIENFTESYDTQHVGVGKTLTPAGWVDDGNSGGNYSIAFVDVAVGEITARAITVAASTDSKIYDGDTTSVAGPSITSGTLAQGDVGVFSQSFDTRDVGTGKTLSAAGFVSDGNSGDNYTITFVDDVTGEITARAITVTASANTKVYDGTTAAAAVPTITSGALASGDAPLFTESYDTRHVGSGKTLTPAGLVDDGNGGANYSVTFVDSTAGVITARAITVTATANTKVYDGTTTAAAVPTISSGALAQGDSPAFLEAYDTRHVGSGKTLTPSGSVNDGNSGANYTITFVAAASGTITARAITVTAATNIKVYDGATTASATPTITSGSLASGDSATFSETFNTRHVGTKTLTAVGTVRDGNGGANYQITFVTAVGQITPRGITVAAVANTKIFDTTTSAAAVPVITSGTLAAGDTAAFLETYSDPAIGVGKLLTPSGAVSDGNGGANYAVTFTTSAAGVITVGPFAKLIYLSQPVTTSAGTMMTLVLQAADFYGNPIFAAGIQVTLTLPGSTFNVGATGVSQLTVATDANGRATFAGVRILVPGTYSFLATATSGSTVVQQLSDLFTITANLNSRRIN